MIRRITLELTPEEAKALAFVLQRLDYDALGRIFRPRRWRWPIPPPSDQEVAWRALRRLATALVNSPDRNT